MGMSTDTYTDRIRQLCTAFKLPTVGAEAVPRFQQAGYGEALETLLEVLELEAEDRQQRRTTRLRRASRLPPGKTWDTFERHRLPARLQQQLGELAQGDFVEQGVNVLAFGLPGTGKSHALCALGHRLVETGYSVLFTPAYRLVRNCWRPGGTCNCPGRCASWIILISWCWTTWAICPREPRSRKSCSR